MSDKKDDLSEQTGHAEIIDRLYDVALDPVHYEELVDLWAESFSLDGTTGEAPPDDSDEEVGGHVRRASSLLDRSEMLQPHRAWQARLHDVKARAAFLMDGHNSLLAVNALAVRSLGLVEGAPMSTLPFFEADIHSLNELAVDLGRQKEPVSVVMRIRRKDTNRPVFLRLIPVHSDRSRPVVLVVLAEIVWLEGFSEHLLLTFGLTPAEADVVRHIVLGLPANDIALARDTSVETVRSQIKSILEKTEAHSQTELVRTVIGLLDVMSVSPEIEDIDGLVGVQNGAVYDSMRLADGRRYEYRDFGDPNGIVCLYMHMDLGFVVWPEDAEKAARDEGLRVIIPIRAGFGNSDWPLRDPDFRGRTINDMLELLAYLDIDKFVIISQGSDLRFAVTMAPVVEDRLLGIVACAAQLPIQNAAQYERMDKWQRFINWNARYAPKLLPFLVKAGFSLAQRIGKEQFFESVNGGSRADMQAFSEPGIKQAILVGTNVCLSDMHIAHKPFSAEVIDHEIDWYDVLKNSPVSVELYQGDQDPQSPLETVNEIIEGMDHIKLTVVRNAGQILFFGNWQSVLARVKELGTAAQ